MKARAASRHNKKHLSIGERLHKKLFPCAHKIHCAYKIVHTTGHGVYFAAAWWESTGVYAEISIALLGLMIFGLFIHEEE